MLSADSPVVARDAVEGEHGEGGARHGELHQEAGADEEVAGLTDGEKPAQQRAQGGGQPQPELQQGEVLRHGPAALLPLVADLDMQSVTVLYFNKTLDNC